MPASISRQSVRRLTLTDFRNYPSLRLETEAAAIVLTGPNGAGKTNLLEALSLLAPGRGLRHAAYEEIARQGGPGGWAVSATVGTTALGTAWDAAQEQGRAVVIDGLAQRSAGALGAQVRCLWLVPAMDRLFSGSRGDRLRFFDRLAGVVDPGHGTRTNAFEKLMRERNILLEDGRGDAAWLASIEAQMAETGVAIAAARIDALSRLQSHARAALRDDVFPWAELAIDGEIETFLAAMPAVQAEDEYRKLLRDSRGSDRAASRTRSGPHRSDFLVTHGPKSAPAAQCSTGEQKALLIWLILAQARAVSEVQGAPLLLLDEVTAHLDRRRREGLFQTVAELGCQTWMTGTDEALFEGVGNGADFYHVDTGKVHKRYDG
jgi:DNA replication and repair protein RecF